MRANLEPGWEEFKSQMGDHFKNAIEQVNRLFSSLNTALKGKFYA